MSWTQSVNLSTIANDLLANSLRLPTATTTQLEDVADAINTSDYKVAGTVVYNSTTGAIVVASGDAAADDWNSAAGVGTHSPV